MKAPNGTTSWIETHYEVVAHLTLCESKGIEFKARNDQGTGGMYELAEDLTNEFETKHDGLQWDGEFFECIEFFLDSKMNELVDNH